MWAPVSSFSVYFDCLKTALLVLKISLEDVSLQSEVLQQRIEGIRKEQVSLSVRNLKSPPSRTQRKAPHLSLDRSVNLVRKTFSTIIRLLKTCWLFSRFIFRLSSRGYLQSCLCVLAQGLFDSMGSLLLSQALKGTQIQMIVSLWVKIIVSVGDVSCATVRASCW